MKRKGHRQIPDFSRKGPASAKRPEVPLPNAPPPPPPPPPPVRASKPAATSMKSGRRGT